MGVMCMGDETFSLNRKEMLGRTMRTCIRVKVEECSVMSELRRAVLFERHVIHANNNAAT